VVARVLDGVNGAVTNSIFTISFKNGIDEGQKASDDKHSQITIIRTRY
jgi:hypothetical protein